MTRKLFGTDGIRGTANREPVTAETALAVAMAAGAQFTRGPHRHQVVIGKDTRLSGYMLAESYKPFAWQCIVLRPKLKVAAPR